MMGQFGYTPLHYAAEKGHTEIASLLICNGADIHTKNNVSINNLCYITLNTNLIIVKYHCLYMMWQNGNTPLHCALQRDHIGIASLLIYKGADINSMNNVSILDISLTNINVIIICIL